MKIYKSIKDLPKFKNAIITIGTFDGVHKGHQKIIERLNTLAKQNDGESVLITFHPHPRFILQPDNKELKLLNTLEEKATLLERFGLDNLVVIPFDVSFSQMEAEDYIADFLVKNFSPHTIVIGYDHHFGKGRSGHFDLLNKLKDKYHYQLEEISKETIQDIDISSTKIRKALLQGDVVTANQLLGSVYSLSGFVIKGDQIGRNLGFPTANIQVDSPHKLIPQNGVFAIQVETNKGTFNGMLNIGFRPTVSGAFKTIEAHLFDFNHDIYGEKIRVLFHTFLREEQKFESIENLKNQLEKDKKQSINFLEQMV